MLLYYHYMFLASLAWKMIARASAAFGIEPYENDKVRASPCHADH